MLSPKNLGDVLLLSPSKRASVSASRNLRQTTMLATRNKHTLKNKGSVLVNLAWTRVFFKEIHLCQDINVREFELHHGGQRTQHSGEELGSYKTSCSVSFKGPGKKERKKAHCLPQTVNPSSRRHTCCSPAWRGNP